LIPRIRKQKNITTFKRFLIDNYVPKLKKSSKFLWIFVKKIKRETKITSCLYFFIKRLLLVTLKRIKTSAKN